MNTLGVTGQSSTHVARILKEKLSFLPRHDKSSRPQRYSQENTCVEVSLIKLQAWKKTPTQVFSCEYCEIVKNIYFEERLGTATSWERVDRYLAETIKAKKQTITATTELANLAQVTCRLFRVSPLHQTRMGCLDQLFNELMFWRNSSSQDQLFTQRVPSRYLSAQS